MQMGFSTEKVCMANLNIPVLSGSRLPNLSTSSRELCWVKRKALKAVHKLKSHSYRQKAIAISEGGKIICSVYAVSDGLILGLAVSVRRLNVLNDALKFLCGCAYPHQYCVSAANHFTSSCRGVFSK